MDERFEDPSDETDAEEADTDDGNTTDTPSGSEDQDRTTATTDRSKQKKTDSSAETESTTEEGSESSEEPLNIRKDWDSATIYVEPEQSEDIEITFTRLKKQLKRENLILEKNKHFYRGIFEVAFGEHREETKEKIRELAARDSDQ